MVGSRTQRATKMSISNDNNNNNNNDNKNDNNNSNGNNNAVTATAVEKSVVFSNNNNNGAVVETASATAKIRMNLAALQQRDPYITDIVDTAKQVALYSFSSDQNEWERTSIEGSLFVYRRINQLRNRDNYNLCKKVESGRCGKRSDRKRQEGRTDQSTCLPWKIHTRSDRSASPNHGFMILNRLEPNNLIEPIQKDLEFQLHDPFLLYRTPKAIYGIWFYDKDECARVGQLVNSLVQVAIVAHEAKSQMTTRRRASDSDTINDQLSNIKSRLSMDDQVPKSVDIIQLLSKAQHEYNKMREVQKDPEPILMTDKPNKSTECPSSIIRPTPVRMSSSCGDTDVEVGDPPEENQGSHINLETLFRNASIKQIESQQTDSSTAMTANTIQSCVVEVAPMMSKLPSILKKLGSSVPMVEDLEREHRNEQQLSSANVLLPSSYNMTTKIPSPRTTKFTTTSSSPNNQSRSDLLQSPFQFNHLGQTSTVGNNLRTDYDIQNFLSTPKDVGPIFAGTMSQSSDQNLATTQSCSTILPNHEQKNDEGRHISSVHNSPTNFFSLTNTGVNTKSFDFQKSLISATIRGDNAATFNNTRLQSPVLGKIGSQNLLTPADLETVPSSGISAFGISGCSRAGPDTLLSPMAFVTQTRTTSSSSSSSSNSSEMTKAKNESFVAPLSKEQLQEALLYALKNDSSFVSRIHKAYLLSLNAEISKTITQKKIPHT